MPHTHTLPSNIKQFKLSETLIEAPTSVRFFEPSWCAQNRQATRLTKAVLDHIVANLPQKPGQKLLDRYRVVAASFLAVVKDVIADPKNKTKVFAWPQDNNAFRLYPSVGKDVLRSGFEALNGAAFKIVEGSGQTHFCPPEDQNPNSGSQFTLKRITTLCTLDPEFLDRAIRAGLHKAEFRCFSKPMFKINKRRFQTDEKSSSLPPKQTTKLLQDCSDGSTFRTSMITMNEIWNQHPLYIPATKTTPAMWASSATRTFFRGRLDSGGRYFGSWSNRQSYLRGQMQIDREPIAHIDINACQPTLLSSLYGEKLNLGGATTWQDLYGLIVDLYLPEFLNSSDPFKVQRKKLKAVTTELIGYGSAEKQKPSTDTVRKFNVPNQKNRFPEEWDAYKAALMAAVPAMRHLNQDYINGPGLLTFHESEALRKTMSNLAALGIPSYPMHDCIIVKQSDVDTALPIYQQSVRKQIKEFCASRRRPRIDVIIPMSIETWSRKDPSSTSTEQQDWEMNKQIVPGKYA